MLIGYPDPRNRNTSVFPARYAAASPAAAWICMPMTAACCGLPAARQQRRRARLTDAQGKPLEPDMLRQMLSGVSRDVYRNEYGFSLTELEDPQQPHRRGRAMPCTAQVLSRGCVLRAKALKLLDKQADEIFKSGGNKPSLNAALRQLAELRSASPA